MHFKPSTYTAAIAVFVVCLLLSSCKSTVPLDTDNTAAKNRLDQQRAKNVMTTKAYGKTERETKRLRRSRAGRVRVFTYDFKAGMFVCEKDDPDPIFKDCDCGCNPPYEIHELDAIRIRIINVNPFLYKVNLYELQGDQISNENLLEGDLNYSIALDFDQFTFLKVERTGLSITTDDATLDKNVNDAAIIEQDLSNLQAQYDLIVNDSAKSNEVATLQLTISNRKKELAAANQAINSVNDKIKRVKAYEMSLHDLLQKLEKNISFLNRLIQSHNQIIYLLYSPIYSHKEMMLEMAKLVPTDETVLLQTYKDSQETISESITDGLMLIAELKRLDQELRQTANFKSKLDVYSDITTMLNTFDQNIRSFNGDKLIARIAFLKRMSTSDNFTVIYETHSIAENADYLKYKIEFIPNDLGSLLPQSVNKENLELAFKIREGLKLDISSGFVVESQLADPNYYFDRTTDPTGQKVYVRETSTTSPVTPSIAAFLNAYKRTSVNFKLGGALGLGLSNNARIRMYAGPSMIVGRKERVVVTAGLALGAVSRLADGYSVGMELNNNSSLPVAVPTVLDRYKFGVFFGVGLNLTGKQNKSFLEKLKFN